MKRFGLGQINQYQSGVKKIVWQQEEQGERLPVKLAAIRAVSLVQRKPESPLPHSYQIVKIKKIAQSIFDDSRITKKLGLWEINWKTKFWNNIQKGGKWFRGLCLTSNPRFRLYVWTEHQWHPSHSLFASVNTERVWPLRFHWVQLCWRDWTLTDHLIHAGS